PNEDGYFHVNGSDAEFVNVTNGRKVEISPDGLYGRNANGSIRFQADQTLVTSAALGTSNYNVYLAAEDSGSRLGEVRAVKTSTLGGSGNSTDYEYIDIRARSIKSAYGRHFYIATDAGELRVMSQGLATSGVYRDVRAKKYYGNVLEVNDGSVLYLRSNNRVRAMRTGESETYVPFEGSDFIQSSSRDLKDNVNDFGRCATDLLCDLNVVSFDYIDGDKDRIGVIAEDSEVIGDGKSVSIADTTFLNVKAIQELKERITKLEELLA